MLKLDNIVKVYKTGGETPAALPAGQLLTEDEHKGVGRGGEQQVHERQTLAVPQEARQHRQSL